MICSTCGRDYDTMICQPCTERRSREAYLELQEQYLPAVVMEEADLNLIRRGWSGPYHIALFNEPTHAYCGESTRGMNNRKRVRLSESKRLGLCPKCVETLDRLAAKTWGL